MSNSNSHNSIDDKSQLREELVAYLDGELDVEQSRRVEQRAASEPETRRALEDLDRTWHLLDELNTSATSEDFTRTTLELVAVAAEGDAAKAKIELPRKQRRNRLIGVACIAAAAVAGFLVVWLSSPDPNAKLLKELPVVENFEQYRQTDDIKFLRMLADEKLFTGDSDDGQ